MSRPERPLEERLFPRIDAEGPCWLWTGAISRNGYGVVQLGGRDAGTRAVHRVVWELLVGLIPRGLDLDHLCRVRHCCNPDHLEPVTRQANVARGAHGAGVLRGFRCDHPETPENTIVTSRQRTCRTCANESSRAYRARQKAS